MNLGKSFPYSKAWLFLILKWVCSFALESGASLTLQLHTQKFVRGCGSGLSLVLWQLMQRIRGASQEHFLKRDDIQVVQSVSFKGSTSQYYEQSF